MLLLGRDGGRGMIERLPPYYDRDGITLYLGDCSEVLPQIELAGAICVTDPPYNAKKNYGKTTNDRQAWPDWAAWIDERFALWQLVAPETLMFLSQTAYRQYVKHGEHEVSWSAIWHKPLSMAVCAAPFMPHWEHICYFGGRKKGQIRHPDGKFVKHSDPGWGSDVFVANVEIGTNRFGHPTPKPMRLMRDIVTRLQCEVLLDPFAGSGTLLMAAKEQGRRAVGIEISEEYCQGAVRRLESQLGLVIPTHVAEGSNDHD